MPELVRNQTAFDKALRRKANRKQRADGGAQLDLCSLQKRSERDVKLRCKLSALAIAGVPGAAKAKRKLNDTWTNRNTQSLDGFWRPQ